MSEAQRNEFPIDRLVMFKHLQARHFNRFLYHGLSITDETVTFPLWNLSGQMVGYQQYRPNGSKKERQNPREGKYYTWVRKEGKTSSTTAWGLDFLDTNKRVIYLLEGVFKACRFHNYGLNALATISNDPKHLRTWLNSLGYEIRPVCDGDKAGLKLAKFGERSLILPDGVYVDDMTEAEFMALLHELET